MTRAEHLQWCKTRALRYVELGDLSQAYASMASDIMKHSETEHHQETNILGMQLMMIGQLSTPDQMKRWIESYL